MMKCKFCKSENMEVRKIDDVQYDIYCLECPAWGIIDDNKIKWIWDGKVTKRYVKNGTNKVVKTFL